MALVSLFSHFNASESSLKTALLGFACNSAAVAISLLLFRSYAGISIAILTTLFCSAIAYKAIEKWNVPKASSMHESISHEHGNAILSFSLLFLGVILSGIIWYSFLPGIHSEILNDETGAIASGTAEETLLLNTFLGSLSVLVIGIIFAFFYGAGAVFLVVWGATLLAAAIGSAIRQVWSGASYLIYGMPEILAYIYGGIAGGIISVAIIRNHFFAGKRHKILMEAGELLFISLGFLSISAVFKIYLYPALLS